MISFIIADSSWQKMKKEKIVENSENIVDNHKKRNCLYEIGIL